MKRNQMKYIIEYMDNYKVIRDRTLRQVQDQVVCKVPNGVYGGAMMQIWWRVWGTISFSISDKVYD